MAREGGGGGGAFGWTILGVIVGVAGTLAVETLMSRHATETEQTPTSAAVAVVTPQPAPPPPVQTPVQPVSSTPAALAADAGDPSHEDVQDDAAAAGMTSRSHTGDADSSAPSTN
ncbi:MAG TPA: hypothetical protein VN805_02265 [Caulobacteraceae bacterium]|nr:hypothetical protein [Caulobacteraceae bacterium]